MSSQGEERIYLGNLKLKIIFLVREWLKGRDDGKKGLF